MSSLPDWMNIICCVFMSSFFFSLSLSLFVMLIFLLAQKDAVCYCHCSRNRWVSCTVEEAQVWSSPRSFSPPSRNDPSRSPRRHLAHLKLSTCSAARAPPSWRPTRVTSSPPTIVATAAACTRLLAWKLWAPASNPPCSWWHLKDWPSHCTYSPQRNRCTDIRTWGPSKRRLYADSASTRLH